MDGWPFKCRSGCLSEKYSKISGVEKRDIQYELLRQQNKHLFTMYSCCISLTVQSYSHCYCNSSCEKKIFEKKQRCFFKRDCLSNKMQHLTIWTVPLSLYKGSRTATIVVWSSVKLNYMSFVCCSSQYKTCFLIWLIFFGDTCNFGMHPLSLYNVQYYINKLILQ